MTGRAEYVCCIADTDQERIGLALCGRKIGRGRDTVVIDKYTGEPRSVKELVESEFVFKGLDHAFNNARNGGRLVVCRICSDKVIEQIKKGTADRKAQYGTD